MPKLTVVIPAYTITDKLKELLINAVNFYRDGADQLIVVEDGGGYVPEIRNKVDLYALYPENKGFTANVNRGWDLSDGDYTAIVSSDTYLMRGDLHDLCIPGKVTSPHIVNQGIDRLAGPFFVVPKEIKEERGMLLEDLHTYSSDSEYDHRVKDIFQKVPSVEIFHHMAQTVTPAGVEGGDRQRIDREIYQRLIKEGKAAH